MIEIAYEVRHFKGGRYWVQGTVVNATNGHNNERLILYLDADATELYVRPETEFWEEVEHEGKQVPRFERIET